MRVLVIGSGIIGASLAWHLARAGAEVAVVSDRAPGGIATANSWAWVNASWGNAESYFRFRFHSLRRWEELAREVPELGYRNCGSLTYDLEEPALKAFVAEHGGWGYPLRLVAADEAARLEPGLTSPPALAAFAEAEGVVEPALAAQRLLADSGARIFATTVHALIERSGRVSGVMTDDGPITADEVIVAAGHETARLFATIGVNVPLEAPAGLLAHTDILPPVLSRLVISPRIHLRQTPEGRIVAGSDFGGSPIAEGPDKVAGELLDLIRAMVRGAEKVGLHRYSVGYRPTPKDGLPIISRAAGLTGAYCAVMHSGVTNAPAVGELVTREILNGERDRLLEPFGLHRFNS